MEDKPLKTEGEEPKPPLHDLSVECGIKTPDFSSELAACGSAVEPAVARRARKSGRLVFAFICSGACASALRFKRAFAEEHQDYTWCLLFPVNRL